jgi:hypothetical protein
MISPNRENIDRWLFDYTEGNLSAEQESTLENFILNNPEIEVDLDAWQDSKLVSEEIKLTNKNQFKRKRRIAPVYFTSLFILLFLGTFWMLNSNSEEKENTFSKVQNQTLNAQTIKQEASPSISTGNQRDINSAAAKESTSFENENLENDKGNSENQFTPTLLATSSTADERYSLMNNEISDHSILTANFEKTNQVQNQNLEKNSAEYNSTSIGSTVHLKRIDSKSLKVEHYQIRNEELQLGENQNDLEGINLELGNIKLFQKIGKVLEKDLGLSNIPDHIYSIPEYSNVDVLFSNIGATSQFRFQSNSMARWIENTEQRKFSQQITLDGYSRGAQSGFGLQANYDYFANGSIQNWNTCLLFSPKIALSRSVSIEPALRFKIGNKLLNEDRIENHSIVNYESQTANQFNFDSSSAIGSKLWYRDLDFGFTINTPYFYVGGQVSNILRHQNNIYSNYENLDMRASNVYNAIIGTQYMSRNQKVQFSPYCFFEKSNKNRLFTGFSLKLNKILIGGSYGTGNIGTGTLGLTLKNFALYAQSSYGYVPAITQNSFTHQLTIRFNSNVDKKSRRYITF